MNRVLILITATFALLQPSEAAEPIVMYVCNQPQAYEFWGSVVRLSHEIKIALADDSIAQLAGRQGPYCKRIASDNLRPVAFATGSTTVGEGLIALADGDNSVVLGWVTPEYYVQYAVAQYKRGRSR